MENFPPEVLLFIFERIPASHRIVCSEVCSLWYEIMLLQKKTLSNSDEYREAYREGDIYNIVRNFNEDRVIVVFKLVYESGSVKLMEIMLRKKLQFYRFAGNYEGVYLKCLKDENIPMYNVLIQFLLEYNITSYILYGGNIRIRIETLTIDSCFHLVCSTGNIFFIKDFIKRGASCSDSGLVSAAMSGRLKAVRLLVDHGAKNIKYAMFMAKRNNHPKVVEYLEALSKISELSLMEKQQRKSDSKRVRERNKEISKGLSKANNKNLPKHCRRKAVNAKQRSSGR